MSGSASALSQSAIDIVGHANALNLFDTALLEVKDLIRSSGHTLSEKYFHQFKSKEQGDVAVLIKAILVDEWTLLLQASLKTYSNDRRQHDEADDSPLKDILSDNTCNEILLSLAEKYQIFYKSSKDPLHLSRAIENLRQLLPIPDTTAAWENDYDEGDEIASTRTPLFSDHRSTTIAQTMGGVFGARVIERRMLVEHQLWEASQDSMHLRSAITAGEYWMQWVSHFSASPELQSTTNADNEAADDHTTTKDPKQKQHAILVKVIKWAIQLQKTFPDGNYDFASGARIFICLIKLIPEQEFKEHILVHIDIHPAELSRIGMSFLIRYQHYPNASDAGTCLKWGKETLVEAIRRDPNPKNKAIYSVNLNYIRHFSVLRFGSWEDPDTELPSTFETWDMSHKALMQFTRYMNYGERAADKGTRGDSSLEGECGGQQAQQWMKRVELLDQAIFSCLEALQRGRELVLRPWKAGETPYDQMIDDWARDLCKMVIEKLRWIMQDVDGGEELKGIESMVTAELAAYDGDQTLSEKYPLARSYTLVLQAHVFYAQYRQEPDTKGYLLHDAIKQAKSVLDTWKVTSAKSRRMGGTLAEIQAHNALANFYLGEFLTLGDMEVLDNAAREMQLSLKAQSRAPYQQGSGDKIRFTIPDQLILYIGDLDTFAAILVHRFRATGVSEDLQEAIKRQETAVGLSQLDRVLNARYHVHLSQYLELCFHHMGNIPLREKKERFLNRALDSATTAQKILHHMNGDPLDTAECLLSICSIQATLMESEPDHSRFQASLEKLVNIIEIDARISPVERIGLYSRLGDVLGRVDDESLVGVGARLALAAIDLCPQQLSFLLGELQYRLTAYLLNLRNKKYDYSAQLFPILGNVEFRTLAAATECFYNKKALPSRRLKTAVAACNILKMEKQWHQVHRISSKAMKLFPLLPLRSLSQEDQEHYLQAFSGFGSMAAAATLEAAEIEQTTEVGTPTEALALLEQGRDIIASQRFGTRADLNALRDKDRRLVERFEHLREILDPSGVDAQRVVLDSQEHTDQDSARIRTIGGRLYQANRDLQNVIKQIREIDGFQSFLSAPTEADMRKAAKDGQGTIVIINMTDWRCDAFIVTENAITCLRLPELTQEDIDTQLGVLPKKARPKSRLLRNVPQGVNARFLHYLWLAIVEPVLNELKITQDWPDDKALEEYPRIWWCPTGNASRLPLHAATAFDDTGCAMRRVVSSYTTSIKALIFSQNQAALRRGTTLAQRGSAAVLCSVTNTEHDREWGLGPLVNAPGEVKRISAIIEDAMKIIKEASFKQGLVEMLDYGLQVQPLYNPTEQTVVFKISPPRGSHPRQSPAIFHFAGHATSHPTDPSKSCLYTVDSKFEISELNSKLRIYDKAPFLAYLSACNTGVNTGRQGGKAAKLTDEGIHIMGSMQLVGFVAIVGSLWMVADSSGSRLAKTMYERLFSFAAASGGIVGTGNDFKWEEEGAVARCLHYAVMQLRDTTGDDGRDVEPINWAPFIHMGA